MNKPLERNLDNLSVSAAYGFEERSHCPVCRSEASTELYCSPFDKGPVGKFIAEYYKVDPRRLSPAPYQLMRCEHCRLVYQKWVGDNEFLAELYGRWIDEHCPPEQDPQYQYDIQYFLQSRDAHELIAAAAFLGLRLQDLATLDYGMGWALWARIAKRLGCSSYGSEIADTRVEYARAHGVTTLDDDHLGEPRFHFINTEQVFEHLTCPRETAELLAASLLPGGILKISVPSGNKLDPIIEGLRAGRLQGTYAELMPVQPLEHVNSYSSKCLDALAEILGLQIVRPTLSQQYAFMGVLGATNVFHPRKAAKELVRPVYQLYNSKNLYVWMRNRSAPRATGGNPPV